MSIFGSIVSAIFGTAKAAGEAVAGTVSAATAAVSGSSKPKPMSREEVEAMIQKIANDTGRQNYNWKQSIVDLMKLLDLDFEPQRAQATRTGARLYRRPRRLGPDEHLAAQAGHDQSDGKRRRGARKLEIENVEARPAAARRYAGRTIGGLGVDAMRRRELIALGGAAATATIFGRWRRVRNCTPRWGSRPRASGRASR